MKRSIVSVASLLVILAGNALAQVFPSGPLRVICTCIRGTVPEQHLQGLTTIAAKYLGQPVTVESSRNEQLLLALTTTVRDARPDGYTLATFPIPVFRIPHMRRVHWDPVKDFTHIIGLAGYTFGVVVKSDSQFKSLKDLIDYAKANPGLLRYGGFLRGSTQHLNMEELDRKTGARLLYVPGTLDEAVRALNAGHIMAISEQIAELGSHIDSGAFRLLATFGEQRSRWNVPTARELGFDIVSYAPFGIVGPKGMDPKVTKLLHDAFYRTLDDPEYDGLMNRLDLVDWYKSSEDYAEWAIDQFKFQRALIQRTVGLGN